MPLLSNNFIMDPSLIAMGNGLGRADQTQTITPIGKSPVADFNQNSHLDLSGSNPVGEAFTPATGAYTATATEPTPATSSAGEVPNKQFQPIQTGSSFMSTGAAIGGMGGSIPGAIGGAGAGYLIDTFIAGREEEKRKRELAKQMRLEMMRQRYQNNKELAAARYNGQQQGYANRQGIIQNRKAEGIDRLNRIHAAISNRAEQGFVQ